MKLKEAVKINPNAILIHSGILFDVFNPKDEDIKIEDIAHSLSNVCRYGGHSPKFYSVAQHCVICSYEEGTTKEKLEFLLHDASEAYLSDMPRPIKKNMPNYVEMEDNLLALIFKKFELNFPLSKKVHNVDDSVLAYEYRSFFEIKDENFDFWTPEYSKKMFLDRYYELLNSLKM